MTRSHAGRPGWGGRVVLGLVAVAMAGCGAGRPRMDYSKAGLVQVSGQVRFDGRPLADAIVIFEAENGSFSFARTDASGRYSLMFDSEQPGVTKGVKTVRIRTTGSLGEDDPDAVRDEPERLPPCYNVQSTLRTIVERDDNAINFDLPANCE
jgi:hypothetical protein